MPVFDTWKFVIQGATVSSKSLKVKYQTLQESDQSGEMVHYITCHYWIRRPWWRGDSMYNVIYILSFNYSHRYRVAQKNEEMPGVPVEWIQASSTGRIPLRRPIHAWRDYIRPGDTFASLWKS